MRLEFTLAGVSPLIMHNGAAGLDTRSALSREIAAITAKRGRNRTDVDDKRLWELECRRSLYLDADGRPTLPPAALRAMIEAGARKAKQGSLVREGLMIESVTFRYDVKHYGEDVEKLSHDHAVRRPGSGDASASFAAGRSSTARGQSSASPMSTRSWWTATS